MTGAQMAAEMAEQPARLRQLIGRFDALVERVRDVAPDPMNGACMVARGSSDHAAVYGRYLLEAATGKPVSLAAPSLHTLYGVDVDYRGQLVIGVSRVPRSRSRGPWRPCRMVEDAGSRSPTMPRAPSLRRRTGRSTSRWARSG